MMYSNNTMKLAEIISILEKIAPPELADEWDRGIGLIVDRNEEIQKIATSLDLTDHVLKEAAAAGADMLVCHHPPIYIPVNRISRDLGNTLKIALDNKISIYAMHTNYDRAPGGVNDVLALLLGLDKVRTAGMGRIGTIAPTETAVFARQVAEKLGTHVTYAGDHLIETVMVLGGSGLQKEFIEIALHEGVDAFVSGEMRHNAIRYAEDISLIDATHYATENPAMKKLAERLPVESIFIDHKPSIHVIP
jgi:dinuclear metal center YbgI/SA1388 family protein